MYNNTAHSTALNSTDLTEEEDGDDGDDEVEKEEEEEEEEEEGVEYPWNAAAWIIRTIGALSAHSAILCLTVNWFICEGDRKS